MGLVVAILYQKIFQTDCGFVDDIPSIDTTFSSIVCDVGAIC